MAPASLEGTKVIIQDFLKTSVCAPKSRLYQRALYPLEDALASHVYAVGDNRLTEKQAAALISHKLIDHLVAGLNMGGAHRAKNMQGLARALLLNPQAADNEGLRSCLKRDFEHRGYASNPDPVWQTIATAKAIEWHPPFAAEILPLAVQSCIERPAMGGKIVENDKVFYVNAADLLESIVRVTPETAPKILNAIAEDNILPVKLPENGLRLFSICAGLAPALNAKAVAHFEKVALAYRKNGWISFGQQNELSDAFIHCAISLYRTVGTRTNQMMAAFKGVSSVVRSETAVRRINAQTALGEKLVALLLSKRPKSKDFLFAPSLTRTFFVELNKDSATCGLPPRPMPAEIEPVIRKVNPRQG